MNLVLLQWALMLLSPPAPTSVGPMSLEDLVRYSDAIVLGRVARVVPIHRDVTPIEEDHYWSWTEQDEVPIAEVEVLEVFKGSPATTKLYYLACGTWTCDISSAEVGETSLLFLSNSSWTSSEGPRLRRELETLAGGNPLFDVMHSGRGRMPLSISDGKDYVTAWVSDVILPEGMTSIAGPEPKYEFIRSIARADVARYTRATVAEQSPFFSAKRQIPDRSDHTWTLELWGDGYGTLSIANRSYEFSRKVDRSRLAALAIAAEGFFALPPQMRLPAETDEIRTLSMITSDKASTVTCLASSAVIDESPGAAELSRFQRLWSPLRELLADRELLDRSEMPEGVRAVLDRER